jgi:hypothetical protein
MSNLQYKIGDKFRRNQNGLIVEIIEIQGGENPYVLNGGGITNCNHLEAYYTKVIEFKVNINEMNIEENKHHQLWEGVQSLDVMKQVLTDEEYKGFLKGNILKYQLRLGKKDDTTKEIKKINDYSKELNKMLGEK